VVIRCIFWKCYNIIYNEKRTGRGRRLCANIERVTKCERMKNTALNQGCPKCGIRAHFTWLAALFPDCVVYGLPKHGSRFCVGTTAASQYFKMFFPVFWCVGSEFEHENRHKWSLLLQTLSEMTGLCWPVPMQERTVSPRVFSHDQNLARFEKSFNNPALSFQALN